MAYLTAATASGGLIGFGLTLAGAVAVPLSTVLYSLPGHAQSKLISDGFFPLAERARIASRLVSPMTIGKVKVTMFMFIYNPKTSTQAANWPSAANQHASQP